MTARVRRICTVVEDVVTELGRPVATPVRRAAVAAVITNPWSGRGVVTDLNEEVVRVAPLVAHELTSRLLGTLGGADRVEAFGKAAIVGLGGETEHAGALIHTPYFGNLFREITEGSSVIVFSDERAEAGAPLTVPMWHKVHAATRSHYQTITVRVPDAPRADEIVVIAAGSTGGRPNARIGDRSSDPQVRLADHPRSRYKIENLETVR
ncbi:amino acid synthesis family protein [Streptomyces sporangiiformans]|uniref:Amino acid synthesis family protein n=1 Tax=Streptomyces sporangiiformans TaxID=2315329 RepID=A0A505D7W7_9ACTN|nr:amino acid synthesis family protein [Streptomyces sporangiiformans]TPQ15586.1 amino acid synthesis family protein [Streptomyces sporangiiformans]